MNQEKFKKINKACFLDRDGVLNEDIGYLHKCEDFKWIDGAVEAIKLLKKNNFLVIVITNQSGISRGYFTSKDVINLHEWMNKILKKEGIQINDFFFSEDLPNNNPESRRKPSPKMINEAVEKYKLDKTRCFMIGDKLTDLEAAKNAQIKGFLFNKRNLKNFIEKILDKINF